MDLVTYADLKALLNLDAVTIATYPDLALIQAKVTAAIESYTGRYLESKELTETFYLSSQSRIIRLYAVPITEIDSISIDSVDLILTDDYSITNYGIYLVNPPVVNSFFEITYTGGFSAVPDAIARAALLQTAYEFQSKDQIGATSVTTEGGSINRPELGLLKEVQRLLNPFKHPLLTR